MASWAAWKGPLRLLWGGLLLILVGVFIFQERASIGGSLPYLAHADYGVLMLLVMAELIYYVIQALAVCLLYSLYGRRARLWSVTAMLLQAAMLNVVIPTSGASGIAGFVYWGDKTGLTLRDSVAVSIWLSLLTYVTLVPIVVLCLRTLWLLPAGADKIVHLALYSGMIFTGIIALILLALYHHSHKELHEIPLLPVAKLGTIRYYLTLKVYQAAFWYRGVFASYTREAFSKEWERVRRYPLRIVFAIFLLTLIYGVRVMMLQLSFWSLHTSLSFYTAVYVYALTLLFSVVSLTPTTLGVEDVALASSLRWFGMPLSMAIAGTILYRVVSFWLPIPLGLTSQWWLATRRRISSGNGI